MGAPRLEFHPLTPQRWADFESLFGPRGAYAGCWCMWWRETRGEFDLNKGEGNRLRMKALVDSGIVPGILAYEGERAVGWVSVAPRGDFPSLNRSRVLKPLDDQPVWSIVCFFVDGAYKGKGLGRMLIRAAVEYAASKKARIVEAYPTIPKKGNLPPVSVYMGLPEMFRREGFVECARPSKSKLVMRRVLES